MTPSLRIWGACRTLAVRTRQVAPPRIELLRHQQASGRWYSDDASSPASTTAAPAPRPTSTPGARPLKPVDKAEGAADDQPPEHARAADDGASKASYIDMMDDAALEQILYGGRTVTSETEGGLTARQEETLYREGVIPPPERTEAAASKLKASTSSEAEVPVVENDVENPGHKFALPKKPYAEGFNMKQRYHPVLEQITRLLMRDGKLSVAQRNVAMVMNFLRTAPAPIYSPKFPLLPGTPPASHLPLNPILYMTIAIDSVAPLLKVRNIAGAGGGGRALEMPVPLPVRGRRRMAFQWILDVINKKPSKGSGRKQFPHRIAEEIIAVVEGRSSVWEKRRQVHKLGTAARANVSKKLKLKKKK
ncbi:hypothetical protein DCS_06899 [Drechmeria coniospora]|uniref:Small ribosomal subunit protein uS7m n=1 Tax=Drechmeria coniospora TaxID=98403 RepID=A0A151GCV5_DRECN|nr:hypothetical protein DCS_06899 [Drechmeria coniospora]KYK54938.1 hypothetical protein DCS_06899 [Drechmeria coniospora]ODA79899.1 hypothetical protein RJ55_05496 [Drechmeria coniospora]